MAKTEYGQPLRGMFCCGKRPTVLAIDNHHEVTVAELECKVCRTHFEIRETPAYVREDA